MRDLSATKLEIAQKKASLNPLIKITLTHSTDTVTLREDKILNISHEEEPYRASCKLVCDNSDGYFTELDFKGWKAVISYGLLTKNGEEFSDTSPLWVIAQQLDSSEGKLICTLTMVGIPNMLSEDRASASYVPDEDDSKTVKTLIREIAGDSGVTHLACFNHTQKYDVAFDSEDSLIDSYKPKDTFRVYINSSRLAAIRRLLDYTWCVIRYGADGKLHILKPTISEESFNYEYSLEDHVFFSKAYRKTLVIPNKIIVQSRVDDDPQSSGEATDPTSYALLPKTEYHQMRLTDNGEAADIADAILSKYQLNAEMGAANVSMNVGAEVFDYVKVTDAREGDSRIGNIGSLTRTYSPGKYTLSFSFGAWLTVRKILSDLEVSGGVDFERLSVDTLYAKHILLSDIDDDGNYRKTKYTSITPEGMVILDQVIEGDYGLTKKASLTAEGLVLLDQTWGDIDDIGDGSIYQRVKSASLSASGLVLLDQVVVDTYGLVLATDISAGHIKLESTVVSGKWYDTSGIEIDASQGIKIWGNNNLKFYSSSNYEEGNINATSGNFWVAAYHYNTDLNLQANDGDILLSCGDNIILRPAGTTADELLVSAVIGLYPYTSNDKYLGASGSYWKRVYAGTYYGKNTTIQSFQNHNDIDILRGIRDNGGHLVPSTFPKELIETKEEMEQALEAGNKEIEGLKHNYDLPLSKVSSRINIIERNMAKSLASPGINIMNWQSLLMGTILQMAERMDKIEGKVDAIGS